MMMGTAVDSEDTSVTEGINDRWLERTGWIPRVISYADATALLNNPDLHADFASLFRAVGAGSGLAGVALESSLLSMNGDQHKRLRAEVANLFTPHAVNRVRPVAAKVSNELASRLSASTTEFMSAFATPYIETTTANYLGFSMADIERNRGAVQLISEGVAEIGTQPAKWDRGVSMLVEFALERLADPEADTVLAALAKKIADGAFDEQFAATLIATLLSAGQEPTIFQLGLLIQTFAAYPQVWEQADEGAVTVERVVEEGLRYRSTNPGIDRRLNRAVDHRAVTFVKGSRVHFEIAQVNRDPARFGCPAEYDLEANNASHMAFGFGPHFCLGAALARAQLQEAIRALVAAFHPPVVKASVDKAQGGLRGPTHLEIEFRRR